MKSFHVNSIREVTLICKIKIKILVIGYIFISLCSIFTYRTMYEMLSVICYTDRF